MNTSLKFIPKDLTQTRFLENFPFYIINLSREINHKGFRIFRMWCFAMSKKIKKIHECALGFFIQINK